MGRLRLPFLFALVIFAAGTAAPAEPRAVNDSRAIPVYVFAGQSNMVGASAVADDLPDISPSLLEPREHVLFYGPTDDAAFEWRALEPPTEIAQTSYGPGFGPELSAAATLANGNTIAIVKYARDGTNLYAQWDPDRPDGLYATLMSRVRRALGELQTETRRPVRVAAFFWMQGEGDSYRRSHALAYGAHLENLARHVRADLGEPNLAIVIGRINTTAGEYSSVVRDEQTRVAAADPNMSLVETQDLAHDPRSMVHLSSRGEVDLGRRFARALR